MRASGTAIAGTLVPQGGKTTQGPGLGLANRETIAIVSQDGQGRGGACAALRAELLASIQSRRRELEAAGERAQHLRSCRRT